MMLQGGLPAHVLTKGKLSSGIWDERKETVRLEHSFGVVGPPSLLTLNICILQVVQALEMATGFVVLDHVVCGLMTNAYRCLQGRALLMPPRTEANHCHGCYISSSWSAK